MPTQTTENKPLLRIRLDGVRLSFPALFQPRALEGSKPKFSADLILDKKKHAEEIKKLEKMIERAALDKFEKKIPLKNIPLHDGNDREDKEGYGDEVMYLVAKSTERPAVIDRNKAALVEEDGKIYGGCYVNALVDVFAYSHPTGGKGVSCGLKAVQFVKDGPSFGAQRVNVDEDFDEVPADDVNNY